MLRATSIVRKPAVKAERVAEVLARHGVAADAGPAALIDALRRNGWRVVVDDGDGQTGQHRATATAWRADPSAPFAVPYRQSLRATKSTEGAALAALLAKALERGA